MCRDIINAPALQSAIDDALEGLPPALWGHRSALRAGLAKAAERHASVRMAKRRKCDPGWAQRKFADGNRLYRFHERERNDLIQEIKDQFEDLAQVGVLAKGDGPLRADAAAFLRGLPHRDDDLYEIGKAAWQIFERARVVALRSRRHEVLREPAQMPSGELIATLCISIDAVIRLGRDARNCLANSEAHWRRVADGHSDIWSIREGDRLVAVLEVARDDRRVVEAQGTANAAISARDIHPVAQFVRAAGFDVDEECYGLLPEFAQAPIVGPTIIVVKRRVALYVEWPLAVRIDISGENDFARLGLTKSTTLALAFDPNLSCAEDLLATPSLDAEIRRLGRRNVRRIVQAVALAGPAPTLVQHRLQALAA